MDKGKKCSRKRKKSLIAKHTILDPSCKCTNDCKKIDDEVRREIHTKYWKLSYDNQQAWLCGQTRCKHPTQARIRGESRQRERKQSNTYFLPNKGEECQKFFLSNLGYTGNSILCSMFAKMTPTKITPPSKRGKHDRKHKMRPETINDIKAHINQFNPSVSHYRRNHAPLRLYLPPELSIREMCK